jgi:hypothetical protein
MANAVYPEYKDAVLTGASNVSLTGSGTTGLYALLIDTGTYTYSAAHEFYSDLSGIVGTEVELASKTVVAGLLDCADFVFSSVSGSTAEAVVLYVKNAGANTTWRLVAYIDTGVSGLPLTPSGTDVNVTVNASGLIQF